MDWETLKEFSAFMAVIAAFIGGLFVGVPRAFSYHERRLQELSAEYRKREEEQEARHRTEMKDMIEAAARVREADNKRYCDMLAEIAKTLKALEDKFDRFTKQK